jgi:hypothetical protein
MSSFRKLKPVFKELTVNYTPWDQRKNTKAVDILQQHTVVEKDILKVYSYL